MRPTLFPIHRPRVGISVSASALSLVALRRPWFRRPIVKQVVERSLPSGLLKVSATEPHITDLDAFVQELRALTEGLSERTVALSVPNRAMHMGVFAFDRFPDAPEERAGLIKWRFREDLNLTIGDARVMLRVFPTGTRTQVLAVAVRQTILDQYEDVCGRAGLIPVSMGFSHLQLIGLYRRLMKGTRRLCVMHWTGDEFMLLLFDQGQPVFLRTKSMTGGTQDLRRELVGTLQYMADQATTVHKTGESSFPLYLIGGQSNASITQLLGGEATVTVPGLRGGWQLEVVPLGWDSLPAHLNNQTGSLNGLSAMATVVG